MNVHFIHMLRPSGSIGFQIKTLMAKHRFEFNPNITSERMESVMSNPLTAIIDDDGTVIGFASVIKDFDCPFVGKSDYIDLILVDHEDDGVLEELYIDIINESPNTISVSSESSMNISKKKMETLGFHLVGIDKYKLDGEDDSLYFSFVQGVRSATP